MVLMNIHHAGRHPQSDRMVVEPFVPTATSGWIRRCAASAARRPVADGRWRAPGYGAPDAAVLAERQDAVSTCQTYALVFLLGSRYCETDRLTEIAWRLFGWCPPADAACRRSATTCTVTSPSTTRRPVPRTAWEALQSTGVCRDYAHPAIAFCRCMNIPARYCTGYLGDIGVPPPWPYGLRRVVRGASVGAGTRSTSKQRAAHRTGADRAGTGRNGRRDQQHVRTQHTRGFPGADEEVTAGEIT
jgi:transglutaminase-like putative cysteine protease